MLTVLFDGTASKPIPVATDLIEIKTKSEEFATLFYCDTMEYCKFNDSKAIKKILAIHTSLNDMGERKGVKFSATNQRSVTVEPNIED